MIRGSRHLNYIANGGEVSSSIYTPSLYRARRSSSDIENADRENYSLQWVAARAAR